MYAADGQFFVERVLASYINRIPKDKKIILYSPDQKYLFNSYLFYNNIYTRDTAYLIRESLIKNTYTFENVEVRDSCIDTLQLDNNAILITTNNPDICKPDGESIPNTILNTQLSDPISIPAINDGGELYKIFGDTVCNQYHLSSYIVPRESKLFAVESLSDQEFCTNWITDYN